MPFQIRAAVVRVERVGGILPLGRDGRPVVQCIAIRRESGLCPGIGGLVCALLCIGGPEIHGQLTSEIRPVDRFMHAAGRLGAGSYRPLQPVFVGVPLPEAGAAEHCAELIAVPRGVGIVEGQLGREQMIAVSGDALLIAQRHVPVAGDCLPCVAFILAVFPSDQRGLLTGGGSRAEERLRRFKGFLIAYRFHREIAEVQRDRHVVVPEIPVNIHADHAVFCDFPALRRIHAGFQYAVAGRGIENAGQVRDDILGVAVDGTVVHLACAHIRRIILAENLYRIPGVIHVGAEQVIQIAQHAGHAGRARHRRVEHVLRSVRPIDAKVPAAFTVRAGVIQ